MKTLIDKIISSSTSLYLISDQHVQSTNREILDCFKSLDQSQSAETELIQQHSTKLLFLFSRFARWIEFHHYEQEQRKFQGVASTSEDEDSASDRDMSRGRDSRTDSDIDSSLESSSDFDFHSRGKKRKPHIKMTGLGLPSSLSSPLLTIPRRPGVLSSPVLPNGSKTPPPKSSTTPNSPSLGSPSTPGQSGSVSGSSNNSPILPTVKTTTHASPPSTASTTTTGGISPTTNAAAAMNDSHGPHRAQSTPLPPNHHQPHKLGTIAEYLAGDNKRQLSQSGGSPRRNLAEAQIIKKKYESNFESKIRKKKF